MARYSRGQAIKLPGAKITDRIDARAREADALVRTEAAKHRHALAQVITWAFLVFIYCATGAAVAERLGVPLTSLVAPALLAPGLRGQHARLRARS